MSTPQKDVAIPAAILLGSAAIAAGIYFGLQRRDPPPSVEAAGASSPERRAAGAAPPVASPAVDVGELRKRVEAEATKALEARRAEFVARCWVPSFEKNPEPPKAKYLFNMSFDAGGREIARGISEVRGMARADTAQCLRALPLGIQVPAPGVHLGVEVAMVLP